ncbi:hypothetical protein GGR56DRAFT_651405, partial [Xylariaceae sp. FL0804]
MTKTTTTKTKAVQQLSAVDRVALAHLGAPQQRALLAAQRRGEVGTRQEGRRRRAAVDRKGNRNLYAYWHTETPVYLCG